MASCNGMNLITAIQKKNSRWPAMGRTLPHHGAIQVRRREGSRSIWSYDLGKSDGRT
jgi:hypothetical protein